MVKVESVYKGDLRCESTHCPSGNKLVTDAPADNMGKGEAFSPTDLVATALGTCILTTMAIVARRSGLPFEDADVAVKKEMTETGPRRIARLTVTLHIRGGPTDPEDRRRLESAAHACPVHKSIHPDTEMPLEIFWD